MRAFDDDQSPTTLRGTLVRSDDLVMELDAPATRSARHVLPGMDRRHSVCISKIAVRYYYATDHPANVTGLIDGSTNQPVNEYEYGPWGLHQPLRYAAREWDATAGLYQVRARWYDPHTGRFVSEDPIGLAGGLNVYAYTMNNPVNYTDPSGLCVEFTKATYKEHMTVAKGKEEYCPILLDPISSDPGGGERPWAPLPTWPSEPGGDDSTRGSGTGGTDGRVAPAASPTWTQCMEKSYASFVAVAGGMIGLFAGGVAIGEVESSLRSGWYPIRGPNPLITGSGTRAAILANERALLSWARPYAQIAVGAVGFAAGYVIGAGGMCAMDRNYYSR